MEPSFWSSSSSSISHSNYFTQHAITDSPNLYKSVSAGYSLNSTNFVNMQRDSVIIREPIPPGFYNRPVDFHDPIHREIEKQRIKKHMLIEEEIAHKRMLEEEVIREILMERELRMRRNNEFLVNHLERGTSFDRRSAMGYNGSYDSGGVETMPFQRIGVPKIMENKLKEKVVILPKPNSICGTKQKGEWVCTICEISATREQDLIEHFEGKKHKTKEAQVHEHSKMQNSLPVGGKVKLLLTETPVLGLSGKNQNVGAGSSTKIKGTTVEKRKKNTKFWCEICKVGTDTLQIMDKHKEGKKHLQNLQRRKKRSKCSALKVTRGSGICKKSKGGKIGF